MPSGRLGEVQTRDRALGVAIVAEPIAILLAQMMRKVQVEDPGDSDFLPGAVADKFRFREANQTLRQQRKKPATASPLLLGITKASLQSDSFISAASFQETTKVLTEAALAGKQDDLVGLKENVILGHLVPTGTGFRNSQKTRVLKNVDLQAAAEEIGRLSKQGFLDEGGPVIRLEGIDEVPATNGGPIDSMPPAVASPVEASPVEAAPVEAAPAGDSPSDLSGLAPVGDAAGDPEPAVEAPESSVEPAPAVDSAPADPASGSDAGSGAGPAPDPSPAPDAGQGPDADPDPVADQGVT